VGAFDRYHGFDCAPEAPERSPIPALKSDTDEARADASPQASPAARFEAVWLGDGETPALRGVSFALAPGSFHVLLGGTGTTDLLRLMAVLDRPHEGRVQVFGRDVAALSRKDAALMRRRIGFVARAPTFIEHLGVWDNAALAPRVAGRNPRDYAEQVDAVLKWMGLAKAADTLPGALSPAERYRLAMARAVAGRPEMLLVDAPPASLDPAAVERALKLAGDIHAAGATVVFATGDEALARSAGAAILRLEAGRLSLVEPA
jgi:cell division transport system ATP-binding protein